jgi:hypothetical protein
MSLYTKSLLHFNGADGSTTFTDETGKTWTAAGNAKLSTAQKKFGTASGYFDGTGDYISTPGHADFHFGTGDFTIDFWVNCITVPDALRTFVIIGDHSTGIEIGRGNYYIAGALCQTGFGYVPGGVSFQNNWHHIAIVRASSNTYAFCNGVLYYDWSGITNSVAPSVNVKVGDGHHGYIDELRISNTAKWTANFTPPTSEYKLGLYQNVVIDSIPNIRELINRIAYEASSVEYWDAGQHNLVYLPTHTTVTKTIDANRIDQDTLSVSYTDRVDLINSMTLWYDYYWAGYSGDAAFRKAVTDSDSTSIASYGTLKGDPSQFKYLGCKDTDLDEYNAKRALRWILTQQKNPRFTVEFTGGYYLTDLKRSNIIQFDFTDGDNLDKALSGLVATTDKFIITDINRSIGSIRIKAVQLIEL